MKFEGKIVAVTGAADGLGREVALRFAEEGATLAIMDVDLEKAEEVAGEISRGGGKALALLVDVSKGEDVEAGFRKVFEELGNVDILVNNAGIFRMMKDFKNVSEEQWSHFLNVNLHGAMRCSQAVIPGMEKQDFGRIINIASIAGVVGIKGMAAYSASKGGMIAFTKALAMEEGEHNITVNCVSPAALNAYEDDVSRGIQLKHSGSLPEENANLILFLASDEANFITGVNYVVDGGRTLGPRRS